MTTNNFNDLAEERDRDLAQTLYHSTSMVRNSSRGWVLTEIKELELEADRLRSLVSTVQRDALERCKTELKEIETATQSRFSRDETAAFEAARIAVFGHVHESASKMLSEFVELVKIIEDLKKCREAIEAIAWTSNA